MPSYCYHLKLELYTTDQASAQPLRSVQSGIWTPTSNSSIFDQLPCHPRSEAASSLQKIRAEKSIPSPVEPRTILPSSAVIDCGRTRSNSLENGGNLVRVSERRWQEEEGQYLSAPAYTLGIGPTAAAQDWRFGPLRIESFDQDVYSTMTDYTKPTPAPPLGPSLGGVGQQTKARYVALDTKNTEAGWGIVHLYREATHSGGWAPQPTGSGSETQTDQDAGDGDDGSILCIPDVPAYVTPSRFLGWIGEDWRQGVSHFRMIMTSRMDRYMALLKFREPKKAREWKKEFDGKVFDPVDPHVCHVTFIKSISIVTPAQHAPESSSSGAVSTSLKPFPPPTPDLVELPTCAICLERMDDTAGLMTILCQHVFHCTCLQTWKGSNCAICRATNPRLLPSSSSGDTNPYDPSNPYDQPFGDGASNLCSVCDCTDDLWICLICGYVGCGRYKGGHAKEHWKDTAHSFSLELETQYIWDYAGDMWVHRLIRDKGDGKVVELPSRGSGPNGHEQTDPDVVPRAKLDSIGVEYTHLLTSQLESQRVYFEEKLNKLADKAASAAASADAAAAQAKEAMQRYQTLRAEHDQLAKETVPALERDLERERKRANKSTELARTLGKSLQEEKKVSEGLMARVDHVNKEMAGFNAKMDGLKLENQNLKEENHDLSMFISGGEKLKEMADEGKVDAEEIAEGTVGVEEKQKRGRRKR